MTAARLSAARRVSASNVGTLRPECMTWIGNVVSNGGAVSATTAQAVSTFCAAIDAAGIRDRFARLNLFCGSNLSAALVPLYRSTAAGGTLLGNSTDTNNNFVSGDYAETGSAGGLAGNGTTKFLNTGLNQSTVDSNGFGHLSVFLRAGNYTGLYTYRMIGLIQTTPSNQLYLIDVRNQGGGGHTAVIGASTAIGLSLTIQSSPLHMVITRSSATSSQFYVNASLIAADTISRTTASVASPNYVFAENRVGTGAQTFSAVTLAGYSIGTALTQSQATAFYMAMTTFQTAMNRHTGV